MPLRKSTYTTPLNSSSMMSLGILICVVSISIMVGLLAGFSPKLLIAGFIVIIATALFFYKFEIAAISLLVLRSSLDIFSAQQLPAVLGIGIIGLTFLYVLVKVFLKEKVYTDWFFWTFFGWVLIQSLWLLFMTIGVLGFDSSYLSESIPEWIRLLLWPSAYLMVMQLNGRISHTNLVNLLFLALVAPLSMSAVEILQNPSQLRIQGTFGHPNVFASFLLIFIALSLWKLNHARQYRLLWSFLLATLIMFLVSTKALFVLVMLGLTILVFILPRISTQKLVGGILLFTIVIGLFASSEFGQERLASIYETPILNPDISINRAILKSESDHNSFNWRLAHWNEVIKAWQQYPVLGYGLGVSKAATNNSKYLPHNDYLRALIEGGYWGIVIYVTFFITIIIRIIQLIKDEARNRAKQDFCLILLGIVLATMMGMLTENIWSHTVFFMYLSVLIAIAGFDWNTNSTNLNRTSSPISKKA